MDEDRPSIVQQRRVVMEIPLVLNACGGPFSLRTAFEVLMHLFQVRCHPVQAKLIENYQLFSKHQVLTDSNLPTGVIVFVNPESGREFGRIIDLYVPH